MTKYKSDIKLGATYQDSVSGWTGICTAIYFYMNGCERVQLDGTDKDGRPDGHVFDAMQLKQMPGVVIQTFFDKGPVGGSRNSNPVPR